MATANDSLSVADSAMGAQGGEAVRGMSGMTKIAATALAGVAGSATAAGLPSLPGGVAAPAVKAAAKPAARKAATGLTDQQAASFLLQAQISCTKADIAAVRQMGYAAWLSREMGAAQRGITGWNWLIQNGYNRADILYSRDYADPMIWAQLINPVDGLRKRVALALSEILVVSTNSMEIESPMFAMAAYWDLLMRHAFGNFRELLEDVTLSPAMGYYLNTLGNLKEDDKTGRVPDENYAREVMQLFTIGLYELNNDGTHKLRGGKPIETYDQDTVSNLARVFTGYDLDDTGHVRVTKPERFRNRMIVRNLRNHSQLPIRFMGLNIPGDATPAFKLKAVLDALFAHPNVGPFIGRQLIQRLVKSSPSPNYVGRVAAAFNDNGKGVRGDMKAVIKAVLVDPEARSEDRFNDNFHGKLREPMLRLAQWASMFNAQPRQGRGWEVWDQTDTLGQSPLCSPSVFNFFRPGYVPPNTEFAKYGLTAPEFQITDESSAPRYINRLADYVRGWHIIQCTYPAEEAMVLKKDLAGLVEHLSLLMCADQLTPATKATILKGLKALPEKTRDYPKAVVTAALVMIMSCPDYIVQK